MDGSRYRYFFLQPTDPRHRQYEALRAVLVDEQPMQEVAQRFGYRYDTVRALVSRFRQQHDARQLPPFSSHPTAADRTTWRSQQLQRQRRRSPRPMHAA
jgi:hypothetical protein